MKTYEISLDLESVLADVHSVFVTAYNDKHDTAYTISDIQTWTWVMEEVDFDEFMDIVDSIWVNDSQRILPSEPQLSETVEMLASHPQYTVDIVTARTGVEEAMKTWLSEHNITGYRDFIATDESKAGLGYDFYIDDNPKLANDLSDHQIQCLVTRQSPWTDEALNHHKTVPVRTVNAAANYLINVVNNE